MQEQSPNNTYSTNNLRNSKTVNGTKTNFVWNGQNLASETTNDVTTVYTYDITGVITSKTDNDSVTRYVKDPHGNVTETSKNNSVLGEYDYTAFGIQRKNTDTSNPFRYCGEYYDTESDSVYLRNRYYNPSTGRFLTEDPVRDGGNWYSYCAGNPVDLVDSNGLRFKLGESISEEYYTIFENAIQKLTDDRVYINEKGEINIEIMDISSKPLGTELVRKMMGDEVDGVIEFQYDDINNYVNWEEYDTVMEPTIELYYPLNQCSVGMYNSSGDYYDGMFVTDMIIGHEFIHVYNGLEGTYVPDINKGVATSKAAYLYTDENGKKKLDIQRTEELNTSGIPYFLEIFYDENGILTGVNTHPTYNRMNENALRKEHGYDTRARY